jgi:hypothetical protein
MNSAQRRKKEREFNHKWPYPVETRIGLGAVEDRLDWCKENNIKVYWNPGNFRKFYFNNDKDLIWFKLRWS